MSEHIRYERTGGFAGLKLSFHLDLDDLPEDQAEQVRELLDETDFFDLPERILPSRAPVDQFAHKIEVESRQGKHCVWTTDSAAPEKLRALIGLLNRLARTYGKQ